MRPLAWLVRLLLFVDELLAWAAAGVWGDHAYGVVGAVLAPVVVVVAWWAFAAPRAPLGGPVVRPVVKVLVFGLATWGLWAAGHHTSAVALLAFSVLVNAAALLPCVTRLAEGLVERG